MDFGFYLTIAISAGTGSALVQLLIQLGVGHWLAKRYHSYTLQVADRRNCADRIIDLINSKHYQSWADYNSEIYSTAYKLSDKLMSLGEKKHSKVLDDYITSQRHAHEVLRKLMSNDGQGRENEKEFLDSQHKINSLREELIKSARGLKK